MTQTTTRRDLLRFGTSAAAYAAGAAIVTGGVAIASEATGAVPTNPRLRRLIALHDQANAAANRFTDMVEEPARAACAAAVEALPRPTPVPHRSVYTTYTSMMGEEIRLSTDSVGAVGCARRFMTDPTWADMGGDAWRQASRELAALADERDAIVQADEIAHRSQIEAIQERHDIAGIVQRSNQLDDRTSDLWHAAMKTSAHSLADVAAKIDFADRTGREEVPDLVLAAISADVRRLTKEGR
jgi:hypothetical protein